MHLTGDGKRMYVSNSLLSTLDHAGIKHKAQIRIQRIQSESIEQEGPERLLSGYDGLLVPGGFGERGIEGEVVVVPYSSGELVALRVENGRVVWTDNLSATRRSSSAFGYSSSLIRR